MDAPIERPTTDFERKVHGLLGLPFDALDLDGAVDAIHAAASERRRCFLTTPNLNYVIACRSDAALRDSVLRSDLSVPDGMPLIWVARLLGIPLRQRVAGSSVMEALRHGDETRLSVYLFGGPDGVAAQACRIINARASGLACAGFHSPGFGSIAEMSTPEVLAAIDRSNADFLMVALPARKGQMWILDNLDRLRPPVVANLGAVVNFIAGTVVRAPERWQKLGLEWLWRIRQEPALWRRYAGDGMGFVRLLVTQVLPAVVAARFASRSGSPVDVARVSVVPRQDTRRIVLSGGWTSHNLAPMRRAFAESVASPTDVELDLAAVRSVDSACIGLWMLLRGHQEKVQRRLSLCLASTTVRRQLARCGAAYLLERPGATSPAKTITGSRPGR